MASNITVEITSPEGGTLNTAGKYCEGDINVTPKLQSKKITENGEVYPDDGHAGLSRVVVNVQPKLQEKTTFLFFRTRYMTGLLWTDFHIHLSQVLRPIFPL